jgi:hypothetical protein
MGARRFELAGFSFIAETVKQVGVFELDPIDHMGNKPVVEELLAQSDRIRAADVEVAAAPLDHVAADKTLGIEPQVVAPIADINPRGTPHLGHQLLMLNSRPLCLARRYNLGIGHCCCGLFVPDRNFRLAMDHQQQLLAVGIDIDLSRNPHGIVILAFGEYTSTGKQFVLEGCAGSDNRLGRIAANNLAVINLGGFEDNHNRSFTELGALRNLSANSGRIMSRPAPWTGVMFTFLYLSQI